ncbi:uncharacterized protein LOC105203932 [Solenopsis invicta]|uniref:uncharacterized protein LOC105203932 n=1 Tax=Solenopsis invicta TaxID=13686 RepID=UPI00193CC80F|nr:uncharacterized protein LOC105203932 [Solenopsis invicta]
MAGKKMRDYVLVKFIEEDLKCISDESETVDVVPKAWLRYNKQINKLVTPFPFPPYTYQKIKDLHYKVINLQEADQKWSMYPIIVVGHASSYDEASLKLNELKEKPYTFTDEENPDQVSNAIMQEIKDHYKSSDSEVPSLNTTDEKKKKKKLSAKNTKKSNATETIPQGSKRKIDFKKKQEMHSQETVKENSNPVVSDEISLNTIKKVLKSMHSGINEIKADIIFIRTEIKDIKLSLNVAPRQTEGALVANMYMLKSKYALNIPISELEEIETLDNKIEDDAEFAADFNTALHSIYVENVTLTKNLTNILKV